MLSGAVQVLSHNGENLNWLNAETGDFVHIPGGMKHAFRNRSAEPVVQLITTTPKLGRFFLEIGKPISFGMPPKAPTPDELQRFATVAAGYRYWLGTPEENVAVRISLF